MKLVPVAVAAVLATSAAHAGGYVAPVVEPAPAPVVSPIVAASDWTGFYAGLQYGKGSIDGDLSGTDLGSEDFDGYGVHAGYNHDFGQFVLGGELDYNRLDIDNVDDKGDLLRLRARAGYDAGRFLPYVTLGAARLKADLTDDVRVSDTGVTYGIGADFKVTERFTVGAEYTRQDFSDVADIDNLDLDTDLVQLRASFRF